MKPGTIHLPLTSRTTAPFGSRYSAARPDGGNPSVDHEDVGVRDCAAVAHCDRGRSAQQQRAFGIGARKSDVRVPPLGLAGIGGGLGAIGGEQLHVGERAARTSSSRRPSRLQRPSALHCRKSAPTSVSLRWATPGEARSIVLPSRAGLASRNSCCEICASSHLPSGLSRRSSTGARLRLEIITWARHLNDQASSAAVELHRVQTVVEQHRDLALIRAEMRRAAHQALRDHALLAAGRGHDDQLGVAKRTIFHVSVHSDVIARPLGDDVATVGSEDRAGVISRCRGEPNRRLRAFRVDAVDLPGVARGPANVDDRAAVRRPARLEFAERIVGQPPWLRAMLEIKGVNLAERGKRQSLSVGRCNRILD